MQRSGQINNHTAMLKSLRRHIMMQQGSNSAWLIGYRFDNYIHGGFGIVPDPTHAVLLNFQVDSTIAYSVFAGYSYDNYCQFKSQKEPNIAFDYWGMYGTFRPADTGTSYISICTLISEIDNVMIGYLPNSHPELAFFVFGGDDINLGNHIYRYYTRSGTIAANACCLWNIPKGNTTRITFLLRNEIYYYNSNGGYVDYWRSSFPNPRTVGVGANVAYFRADYNINETAHLYIRDTNTGDTIWDNGL